MVPTQLLVFDLDGTLLDASHRVPADVRDLLFALREKEIETTLATGRPFAAVKTFIRELELHLPLITFNGALVSTPDGRALATRHLPLSAAQTILGLLKDTSAANHLYLYPTDAAFCTDQEGASSELIGEKDDMACRLVGSLSDLLADANCDPVKMFSIGPRDELEQVKTAVQRVDPSVTCVFSEHDMLEFLGPSVNKGTALSALCDEAGIPCESVIAFGDNMNDFEMLHAAGTGVAMAKAPEKLRKAASCVITDIEEFLAERYKGI